MPVVLSQVLKVELSCKPQGDCNVRGDTRIAYRLYRAKDKGEVFIFKDKGSVQFQ